MGVWRELIRSTKNVAGKHIIIWLGKWEILLRIKLRLWHREILIHVKASQEIEFWDWVNLLLLTWNMHWLWSHIERIDSLRYLLRHIKRIWIWFLLMLLILALIIVQIRIGLSIVCYEFIYFRWAMLYSVFEFCFSNWKDIPKLFLARIFKFWFVRGWGIWTE